MSVAFCFLTIGDLAQPALWQAFLDTGKDFGIFCHPKKPDEISTKWLKDGVIEGLVQTSHGDVSLVAATLNLLRAAFDHSEYEHFILLSETSIPIVPLRDVLAGSESCNSKSVISFRIPPVGSEHFNRQGSFPNGMRMTPFFFHDQWVILSRNHVEKLLVRPRLEWFSRMFAPDEHYFLNVLAHDCRVRANEVINQRKTYVNWQEREVKEVRQFDGKLLRRTVHPKTYHHLEMDEVMRARNEGMWFFRKVSSDCDCRGLLDLVT